MDVEGFCIKVIEALQAKGFNVTHLGYQPPSAITAPLAWCEVEDSDGSKYTVTVEAEHE